MDTIGNLPNIVGVTSAAGKPKKIIIKICNNWRLFAINDG
jgi:hypothetical protein